jgi:hypothetical protein
MKVCLSKPAPGPFCTAAHKDVRDFPIADEARQLIDCDAEEFGSFLWGEQTHAFLPARMNEAI